MLENNQKFTRRKKEIIQHRKHLETEKSFTLNLSMIDYFHKGNDVIFVFLVSWSPWGDYEDCSVTCGEGVKVRRRTCQDPDMTGDTCSPGQDFEEAACTGPTCGMLTLCHFLYKKKINECMFYMLHFVVKLFLKYYILH